MSLIDRILGRKPEPVIDATTLHAPPDPGPPTAEDDARRGDASWFFRTDVFETVESFNDAQADNLRGFIDGNDPEGAWRRARYFDRVRSAIDSMSSADVADLPERARMDLVARRIEARLEAEKWRVNSLLTQGAGNIVLKTTEAGWWENTRPKLARAIMLEFQHSKPEQREVLAA